MSAVVLPEAVAQTVNSIKCRRSAKNGGQVSESRIAWALLFETLDEEGKVISGNLTSFNGPDNPNDISFWLYVDTTPDGFVDDGPIDLGRLNWLIEHLSWVENLEDYDPSDPMNHTNYKVALNIRRILDTKPEFGIRLTLVVVNSLSDARHDFLRQLAKVI